MSALASRLQNVYHSLHSAVFRGMLKLIELGFVPDFITRIGIRHLLSMRLQDVRLIRACYYAVKTLSIDNLILCKSSCNYGCTTMHVAGYAQHGHRPAAKNGLCE